MKFDLKTTFTFSDNISNIEKEIKEFISDYSQEKIEDKGKLEQLETKKNILSMKIKYSGKTRIHNSLLNLKNSLSKEIGKQHHIGVREIKINHYKITFNLPKKPQEKISIPFATVKFKDKQAILTIKNVDEEFLQKNYIDRMINRVKEKVENQYYEGKSEYWKPIWRSEKKTPVWSEDPTEKMIEKQWLKQGPTKGKWFYRPQAAAILRAMEQIAINEILQPIGFQEIIESHIVPFDIWIKTGHMGGMPSEFYYVAEPKTRDPEKWERFIDLTKITQEIPEKELEDNIDLPRAGICYAQCPMIYWSFQGKTIADNSLPVLVYEKTSVSNRYESGGRHGIERVDEFHRVEPVYIGTKEQLIDIRDKLLEKYKHVFNDILNLEWRMAWVTPWYMQQAGIHEEEKQKQECGTIDFEAYMPYRGDRVNSEWLEFQNLSIIGDKYIKAFNIKTQKEELWSGCSGIGLERWATAFLAQKGLNPDEWPKGFRKYLKKLPKQIEFL